MGKIIYADKATLTINGHPVMDIKDVKITTENRRDAYKLCHECGRRFQGKHKYEKQTPNGIVWVHKQCLKG